VFSFRPSHPQNRGVRKPKKGKKEEGGRERGSASVRLLSTFFHPVTSQLEPPLLTWALVNTVEKERGGKERETARLWEVPLMKHRLNLTSYDEPRRSSQKPSHNKEIRDYRGMSVFWNPFFSRFSVPQFCEATGKGRGKRKGKRECHCVQRRYRTSTLLSRNLRLEPFNRRIEG